MNRRTSALALVIAASFAAEAAAQVRPTRPTPLPSPPSPAQQRNRLGATSDTIKVDSTAEFSAPDSVAAALMNRPGFTVTRYEGEVVTFDAVTRALAIAAGAAHKAMVEREGLKVVTDTVIVYDDQSQKVNVEGRYVIIPGAGQSPIAGAGNVSYDVGSRSGRLTNAKVTVDESGERWFIESKIAKTVLGDSTRAIPPRFYGVTGELTSCEDSVPHYHFRMREIKRTEKTLVARPAVLYIKDVPVAWLPFVFQDIRPGRRSGVLPPQIGASDIVRNNPSYRRHLQNIGYYWAFSDYADMAMWMDWRSGAGGIDSLDPGWMQFSGEWKYKWSSRFIDGRFASSYMTENDGDRMHRFSWLHSQRLGRERNFTSNLNYTSSTRLQRTNTINPYAAIATIASTFNFTDKLGPVSLQLGGGQTQYPGRSQIDRRLPEFSLTSTTIGVGEWLNWTPSFRYSETANLRIDQPTSFSTQFVAGPDGQAIRTDSLRRDRYDRNITIGTPIKIFGWDLPNEIHIRDAFNDFPENTMVFPGGDSTRKEERIFAQTYRTEVNWNPSIALPPLFPRLKVSPSISLHNVDGGKPFWVRTHTSGGKFVQQSKRLTYGLQASPAIYGIFPGFGPFQRFRHAISPVISYSYAPKATVSDEFLQAVGENKQTYLGALAQNAVTLMLSQNIEAKVRPRRGDTTQASAEGQKLTVLSMRFTPLTYDFERAKHTGRKLSGFTSENLSTTLSSELLPGFNFNIDHSLFEGSTQTDTARFDPFLTRVSSSMRFTRQENPFVILTRLFSPAVPDASPSPQAADQATTDAEAQMTRQLASQPIAGQGARGSQFLVPAASQGWEVSLNFSTSRPRPLRGDRIIQYDPEVFCAQFRTVSEFQYQNCLARPSQVQAFDPTTGGAPAVQMPRQTNLGTNTRFGLTQKWSASWDTSYDFEQRKFASQIVSLQRDLHDWRAVFAFTHAPNGNFAFNFFIALKPQPELKFDYSRATYRSR